MIDRYGLFLAFLCAAICMLPGCATTNTVPVEVKIPVPVACTASEPVEPVVSCASKDIDRWVDANCLVYQRDMYKIYSSELRAALISCK